MDGLPSRVGGGASKADALFPELAANEPTL